MNIRTLLLLIILGAIVVFAAFNWNAFMAPTSLYLGFASVQAPLGLIMLGLLVLLTALFLVFVIYLQTSVLLETRRHARELQVSRDLAEKAEASRVIELRTFIEMELQRQAALDAEARKVLLARLDQLDRDMSAALEQGTNSISAYIGQLEDRLDRGTQGLAQRPL